MGQENYQGSCPNVAGSLLAPPGPRLGAYRTRYKVSQVHLDEECGGMIDIRDRGKGLMSCITATAGEA
jgi:hypothetical protein